ncbi:MAG: hypothetical protein U5O15_09715 [Candidatus Krumholzibacteriota bacterium]|nr:hypothetical protein [Candidatus Krumholzibacteriota bacterium]
MYKPGSAGRKGAPCRIRIKEKSDFIRKKYAAGAAGGSLLIFKDITIDEVQAGPVYPERDQREPGASLLSGGLSFVLSENAP